MAKLVFGSNRTIRLRSTTNQVEAAFEAGLEEGARRAAEKMQSMVADAEGEALMWRERAEKLSDKLKKGLAHIPSSASDPATADRGVVFTSDETRQWGMEQAAMAHRRGAVLDRELLDRAKDMQEGWFEDAVERRKDHLKVEAKKELAAHKMMLRGGTNPGQSSPLTTVMTGVILGGRAPRTEPRYNHHRRTMEKQGYTACAELMDWARERAQPSGDLLDFDLDRALEDDEDLEVAISVPEEYTAGFAKTEDEYPDLGDGPGEPPEPLFARRTQPPPRRRRRR